MTPEKPIPAWKSIGALILVMFIIGFGLVGFARIIDHASCSLVLNQ